MADRFPGAVVGVMDYSFGNFKLLMTSTPTAVSGGLVRETTATAGANQLAIATFNVENLDPPDPPQKFAELANLIVGNLQAPDRSSSWLLLQVSAEVRAEVRLVPPGIGNGPERTIDGWLFGPQPDPLLGSSLGHRECHGGGCGGWCGFGWPAGATAGEHGGRA